MNQPPKKAITLSRIFWRLFQSAGILLLCYLVCITLPFAFLHPQVGDEYRHQIENTVLTDTSPGTDRVRLITGNQQALEERIRLICQAKERIVYVSFDFRADHSGEDVLSLLLQASQRGVQVQVLTDGLTFLTQGGNSSLFQALSAQPNAEIRHYNPPSLLRPLDFQGRMHDKYMIVDSEFYLLGGRNTYDYFIGEYPTAHPSEDLEVLVWNTAADAAQGSMPQLLDYFEGIWSSEHSKPWRSDSSYLSPTGVQNAVTRLEEHYAWMQETYPDAFAVPEDGTGTVESGAIHLLSNPICTGVKEPQVLYALTHLLSQAEERVIVQTPYAVCNGTMYDALTDIARSVPSLTLLVNSVETGDNLMTSSDYLRSKENLLETGADLFEYFGDQSSHSKCAVMDGEIAIVGSFNWDMRSAYLDTELMLVIPSPDLAEELERYEGDLLSQSRHCVDGDTYEYPIGLTAPEMPIGKKLILSILRAVTTPIRYLL